VSPGPPLAYAAYLEARAAWRAEYDWLRRRYVATGDLALRRACYEELAALKEPTRSWREVLEWFDRRSTALRKLREAGS
jgi:hypothetical protein